MKLVKTPVDEVTRSKDYPGMMKIRYLHKVKETICDAKYEGPKIPPEEWHKILSFFRWTNSEHHSESQVRLFVNPMTGEWKGWAFPQEARTGMSARELDSHPTTVEQRARFNDQDGWIYFGTVHHHCSASAFQSSVDLSNEENQDGLHITVGSMSSDRHDIHCRVYVSKDRFEPDMSEFWDIGENVARLMPPDMHDRMARWQMCEKREVEFPNEWRENVIEIKTISSNSTGFIGNGTGASTGGTYYSSHGFHKNKKDIPFMDRSTEAVEEIVKEVYTAGQDMDWIMEVFQSLMHGGILDKILDILKDTDMTPSHLKWRFENIRKDFERECMELEVGVVRMLAEMDGEELPLTPEEEKELEEQAKEEEEERKKLTAEEKEQLGRNFKDMLDDYHSGY